MTQSYFSYRAGKIAGAVWTPFRAVGRWLKDWVALLIPIGLCAIAITVFVKIGPPHHKPQPADASPAASDASSSDATVAADQAQTDATDSSKPDNGNDRSAAVAVAAAKTNYIFEYTNTGNTGLSILTDRGSGCEYIEERGQPLVPRMSTHTDGTTKQVCDGTNDMNVGDGPDQNEKPDMTADPNRPGFVRAGGKKK
jgi:hypothetical protein